MNDRLVARALAAVPVDTAMAIVAQLCGLDRYQASTGIESAAELIAAAARLAGLEGVRIDRHSADGTVRWWTFAAPRAWTPRQATLSLDAGGRTVLHVDHGVSPFSVAAYSAPTPPGGVSTRLVDLGGATTALDLAGNMALMDTAAARRGAMAERLAAAGAVGYLTDAPSRPDTEGDATGRIELMPDSPLFAFSLTPAQFALARDACAWGARVRAVVDVHCAATMPVVTGVLPGHGPDEVWVMGHLCHPRPGANDNASGVAAALAAADVVRAVGAQTGPHCTIRFLWGPEFVGSAAALHGRLEDGADGGRPPRAVVNLDMVGEDQMLCGSPFVVERPPEFAATSFAALAEEVVDAVFAATASEPGRWHPAPFLGFSDHALFADPAVNSPAVQFCHPADRFNHSSADTIDKVSPVEMCRASAAGGLVAALAAASGFATTAGPPAWWTVQEIERLDAVADRYGGQWGEGLRAYTRRRLVTGPPRRAESRLGPGGRTGQLRPTWRGPLNVRAMLGDLDPASRARVDAIVQREKVALSVLFHLGLRAHRGRMRSELIEETSYGLERPLDPVDIEILVDAFVSSGWLVEAP
jgi:hypothetical protein